MLTAAVRATVTWQGTVPTSDCWCNVSSGCRSSESLYKQKSPRKAQHCLDFEFLLNQGGSRETNHKRVQELLEHYAYDQGDSRIKDKDDWTGRSTLLVSQHVWIKHFQRVQSESEISRGWDDRYTADNRVSAIKVRPWIQDIAIFTSQHATSASTREIWNVTQITYK